MMKAVAAAALVALAIVGGNADVCAKACIDTYAPVCASNGRTYNNDCEMAVAACRLGLALTTVATGECAPSQCEMACAEVYSPVCGTDGATYSNECELEKVKCTSFAPIAVLHNGACTPSDCPQICNEAIMPVCTTGGITAQNLCLLRSIRCSASAFARGTLEVAHVGRCLREDCPRGCEKVIRPVCGSDGRTYDNECILREQDCRSPLPDILAVREGPCDAVDPYPTCAKVVCPQGTVCQTVPKECFTTPCPQYECVAANEPAQPVAPECVAMCPMIWAPICGTNAVTYGNECELESARCWSAVNGAGPIGILHQGECTDTDTAVVAPPPPFWVLPAFHGVAAGFAVLVFLSVLAVVYAVRKRRATAKYTMVVMVDEKAVSMTEMTANGSTNLRDAK